jgi:hypothetical protein
VVQVSEIYDYSADKSPEYFDYDADRQGFSYPHIGSLSPIQLAQVPAPPLPLLLSPLAQLAEAAAALTSTPASPELVWPSPPTLSYLSLSSVEPTSTLSSPPQESDSVRSPSPIDYDNIPTPPGITREELTAWENLPAQPTPATPQPSPCPLTPLPPAEEARLENQENIPPVQEAPVPFPEPRIPIHVWRQPECLQYAHPHQYLAIHTPHGVEERPLQEISSADPLKIPLAGHMLRCPPRFPSVIPFRGSATHFIRVKPQDATLATAYNLQPLTICSRLVQFESCLGIPHGYIKYDFARGIEETFRHLGPGERSGYEGALIVLAIYDFLDGRHVTVYGFLILEITSTYVKWQSYHCEDLLRTYPGLFTYTLTPRLPLDPFSLVTVHPEKVPS